MLKYPIPGTRRELQRTRMEGVMFTCEVGYRGFPGQCLWRSSKTFGIVVKQRKLLVGAAGRQAETASQWQWRNRKEKWVRK
jgi:hypothetical protein